MGLKIFRFFSVNLIFILNLFFCLELKFLLNCSFFWWLDCVIHNFWIPIFIIHHFLCEHHYSLYRLHHRMKEKYKMNAKYLRALTTYLLSESFFFPNWTIRNLLGDGDLRYCRGVAYLFCAVMKLIKPHLAACGVSDYSVKRNNSRFSRTSYGRSY